MVLLYVFLTLAFQRPAPAPQAPKQITYPVQLQPASVSLQGSSYQLQ